MSDIEDGVNPFSGDAGEDHEDEQETRPSKSRRRDYDEDEEDEEEEEEEDEDEGEEDEGTKRGQKRTKVCGASGEHSILLTPH